MNLRSSLKRLAFGVLALFAAALVVSAIVRAQAPQSERWLHVRVDSTDGKSEMARVNLPVSLVAMIVANVDHDQLHHGHINLGHGDLNGVDLRAILDAVRNAPDGEFVTVKKQGDDVRVAKEKGFLVVHATKTDSSDHHTVEVRVPLTVVDAMVAAGGQDLDVAAGLRAMAAHGDTDLVFVNDGHQTVHVWLNSKNTQD
ncbi:MAG: hypothetical protein WAM91_11370 [Candidatus Acidiferrales bacterium]